MRQAAVAARRRSLPPWPRCREPAGRSGRPRAGRRRRCRTTTASAGRRPDRWPVRGPLRGARRSRAPRPTAAPRRRAPASSGRAWGTPRPGGARRPRRGPACAMPSRPSLRSVPSGALGVEGVGWAQDHGRTQHGPRRRWDQPDVDRVSTSGCCLLSARAVRPSTSILRRGDSGRSPGSTAGAAVAARASHRMPSIVSPAAVASEELLRGRPWANLPPRHVLSTLGSPAQTCVVAGQRGARNLLPGGLFPISRRVLCDTPTALLRSADGRGAGGLPGPLRPWPGPPRRPGRWSPRRAARGCRRPTPSAPAPPGPRPGPRTPSRGCASRPAPGVPRSR